MLFENRGCVDGGAGIMALVLDVLSWKALGERERRGGGRAERERGTHWCGALTQPLDVLRHGRNFGDLVGFIVLGVYGGGRESELLL